MVAAAVAHHDLAKAVVETDKGTVEKYQDGGELEKVIDTAEELIKKLVPLVRGHAGWWSTVRAAATGAFSAVAGGWWGGAATTSTAGGRSSGVPLQQRPSAERQVLAELTRHLRAAHGRALQSRQRLRRKDWPRIYRLLAIGAGSYPYIAMGAMVGFVNKSLEAIVWNQKDEITTALINSIGASGSGGGRLGIGSGGTLQQMVVAVIITRLIQAGVSTLEGLFEQAGIYFFENTLQMAMVRKLCVDPPSWPAIPPPRCSPHPWQGNQLLPGLVPEDPLISDAPRRAASVGCNCGSDRHCYSLTLPHDGCCCGTGPAAAHSPSSVEAYTSRTAVTSTRTSLHQTTALSHKHTHSTTPNNSTYQPKAHNTNHKPQTTDH
jgi:hypothetical protein